MNKYLDTPLYLKNANLNIGRTGRNSDRDLVEFCLNFSEFMKSLKHFYRKEKRRIFLDTKIGDENGEFDEKFVIKIWKDRNGEGFLSYSDDLMPYMFVKAKNTEYNLSDIFRCLSFRGNKYSKGVIYDELEWE
jgi:hypothetical protein